MKRKFCCYLLLLTAILSCLVAANDIQSILTNKVEFRTEAPKESFPISHKDCYEFLHGRLNEIRRHGTTWQNGESDCSNCTCDNGDIRCFFHFCNGPSTGYITPPTTDKDDSYVTVDDLFAEESSGYPPPDFAIHTDDEEDDESFLSDHINVNEILHDTEPKELSNRIMSSGDTNHLTTIASIETNRIDLQPKKAHHEEDGLWPPKVVPDKWRDELSKISTIVEVNDVVHPKEKGKRNRSENETHDVYKSYFCGKSCTKICLRGYKVDPISGCWRCKCNKCDTKCVNKCPIGYVMDEEGCETCACLTQSFSTDEDISFVEESESRDPPGHKTQQQQQDKIESQMGGTRLQANEVPAKLEADLFIKDTFQKNKKEEDLFIKDTFQRNKKEADLFIKDTFQKNKKEEPCNETDESQTNDVEISSSYYRKKGESKDILRNLGLEDDATVKSIAKDDQSTLLAILIPMAFLCFLVLFLLMHVWRRYHSDKYDINAYRSEEKQNLRPVKTLHDDQA